MFLRDDIASIFALPAIVEKQFEEIVMWSDAK